MVAVCPELADYVYELGDASFGQTQAGESACPGHTRASTNPTVFPMSGSSAPYGLEVSLASTARGTHSDKNSLHYFVNNMGANVPEYTVSRSSLWKEKQW